MCRIDLFCSVDFDLVLPRASFNIVPTGISWVLSVTVAGGEKEQNGHIETPSNSICISFGFDRLVKFETQLGSLIVQNVSRESLKIETFGPSTTGLTNLKYIQTLTMECTKKKLKL